jgi:5,10-methenyltetrahydromethanopterin hydrogenase
MKAEEIVASIAEVVVILHVIAKNQEALNSTNPSVPDLVQDPVLEAENEKDPEDLAAALQEGIPNIMDKFQQIPDPAADLQEPTKERADLLHQRNSIKNTN